MIPVDLDPARLRIGVVARGQSLVRRLRFLRRGGAKRIRVFSDKPEEKTAEQLGDAIIRRLPTGDDLKGLQVLFIAGLEPDETEKLAELARRRRIIVNCDTPGLDNDVIVPAVVRRGDLTVAVSTGGQAPVLGKLFRKSLNETIGEEWADRMKEIVKARKIWEANGASPGELKQMVNAFIEDKNWKP